MFKRSDSLGKNFFLPSTLYSATALKQTILQNYNLVKTLSNSPDNAKYNKAIFFDNLS